LKSIGVKEDVMKTWRELVAQEITTPEDDAEFE
jgi:hypothetical protein